MLALSLFGEIGLVAGAILLAAILYLVLRPLTVHVTVKHEKEDNDELRDE
jgi:NhaP-type Na+/H+ or K+/H+ antiporter